MSGQLGRPRGPFNAGAALILASALLFPAAAGAQEWDEAYRSGLTALARGDHARAAAAFKRAIALRPEPGRNILTYGTNVEPRYFPYLHLAEAYLGLGQLEAAREALVKSASFGEREPSSERDRVDLQLNAALAQRRPPAPSPAPSATPVATLPSETPAPAAPSPPVAAMSPTTEPAPREPFHAGHVPDREPRPEPRPQAQTPGASSSARPAGPVVATLEVLSQPAGASVYVDDEPVGVTDPQSGRLVKTGLPSGRHRVRVSRAGRSRAATSTRWA